jgi:hypothetical protein
MIILKKSFFRLLLAIILTQATICILEARPISYPNSWTVMQQYNWEKTTVHIHYSPNAKNSIGFLGAYYEKKKIVYTPFNGTT